MFLCLFYTMYEYVYPPFLPPRVTPEHFLHSLLVCAAHCAYNYLNSYFMLEFLRDCESRRKGTIELFWSAAELNITKNSSRENKKKSQIAWKRSRPPIRKVPSLSSPEYSTQIHWMFRKRENFSSFSISPPLLPQCVFTLTHNNFFSALRARGEQQQDMLCLYFIDFILPEGIYSVIKWISYHISTPHVSRSPYNIAN